MGDYVDAALTVAFVIGMIFFGFLGGWDSGARGVESSAIERGYALYCPTDGEFAWKGECDG